MSARISAILEAIGQAARDLPGVFSTPQWGGRAYKLPGPGGNRRKPKLLAFVCTTKAGDAVSVSFKVEKECAAAVIDRYAWIEPHSFGSLGRSGWLAARVSRTRQLGVLRRLLAESRRLHPDAETPPEDSKTPKASKRKTPARGTSPEAAKLDAVMREARDAGWSPPPDTDERFDR